MAVTVTVPVPVPVRPICGRHPKPATTITGTHHSLFLFSTRSLPCSQIHNFSSHCPPLSCILLPLPSPPSHSSSWVRRPAFVERSKSVTTRFERSEGDEGCVEDNGGAVALEEAIDGSRGASPPERMLLSRSQAVWKRFSFGSAKVRSLFLLNIVTVVYASNIPVLKEFGVIDPALFTVLRFAIAAIPFVPFVIDARKDCQTRSAGIELGVWVGLGYLMQAAGLLTSDAGRASFICAFTVIVVPLIAAIFGREVPALTWFGALISLLGMAMLEYSGSPPTVGDLLNLLSAVFFGIHMLRTEHITRNTKKEKTLALLGYEVCVVTLLSAVWLLFRGIFTDEHQLSSGSTAWTVLWDQMVSFPWLPALYTGIFSTGLCLWGELSAMRDVSATETAIIFSMEPVWGAGFAWFLLGERWGTTGWIGAALIFCGSLTVQILGSASEKSETDDDSCNSENSEASDEQSDVLLSTIIINTRKNVADGYRRATRDPGSKR